MERKKKGPVTRLVVKLANNLWWVLAGYVVAVLVGGTVFYAIEGYQRGLNFVDAVYWADITASTVGYGDIAPVTIAGKIMTMIYLKLASFALVALVVANIVVKVLRSEHEYTDEEQDWDEDSIQKIADHLGVELLSHPRDTSFDD